MRNEMLYQLTHEGFIFDNVHYPKITLINILSILRNHKFEKQYLEHFKEIYDEYLETNFLVKNLNDYDKEMIIKNYFQEVKKLAKEEDNV